MATTADIKALQAVLNRYAHTVGFVPLGIDGQLGVKTTQAVVKTLDYVAVDTSDDGNFMTSALSAKANDFRGSVRGSSEIATRIEELTQFFTAVAVFLALPVVAAPPTVTHSGPPIFQASVLPAPLASSSLWLRFKRLAMWQQIALVFGLGVGVLWARKQLKARK